MKINWMKAIESNKNEIEYSFKEKSIFFMDNNDGKTLVVSFLLWAFGIRYDLSKENQRDGQVVVSISHNNKEIIIKRTGKVFNGFYVNENKALSRERGVLFKEIFEIFGIQSIDKNEKSLFKSLMNPGIILQSQPYKDNGYIDFSTGENRDVVKYIYWANAFRDEFKLKEMLEENEDHKKTIREIKTKIKEKKKLLDTLSNNEWTINDDERMTKLETLTNDLKLMRKGVIETIARKSELEQMNQAMTKNKDFADVWRSKYKGMYAILDGKKFTISDFLLEFKDDEEGIASNVIKLAQISGLKEAQESKINNILENIKSIKSKLDRDFIVVRNADSTQLEKEIFALSSENEFSSMRRSTLDKEIKEYPSFDVRSKLDAVVENVGDKINASNKGGIYDWLKINLKSSTGSSPVAVHLGLLKLATENRGLDTPFILDSPFETIQTNKVADYIEKVKNLSVENQIIIFTNKKEHLRKFPDWEKEAGLTEKQKETYKRLINLY